MKIWKQIYEILIFTFVTINLTQASDTTRMGTVLHLTNSHVREVLLSLDPEDLPKPAGSFLVEKSVNGIDFELIRIVSIYDNAFPILIADHLDDDQIVYYRVLSNHKEQPAMVLAEASFDPLEKLEVKLSALEQKLLPWPDDPHSPVQ